VFIAVPTTASSIVLNPFSFVCVYLGTSRYVGHAHFPVAESKKVFEETGKRLA
jgi:hypothetical protein